MVVLPQGDLFAPGPVVSGSKPHGRTWKYCPYSTQITDYNGDTRVPASDKAFHSETAGKLYTYSLGGGAGWVCPDNGCSFFLGTASGTVTQAGRRFEYTTSCPRTEADFATISGSVAHLNIERTIVSGSRYFEI